MKNKLLALLILFVVIGGSVSAFAYWDSLTVDQTDSVTLGNGVTLTISSSTADSALDLVPATAIVKPGDTTSIVFTYNVKLDEAVSTPLNLTTTVSNVQVGLGTNPTLNGLVSTVVGGATTVNGSDVQVTVTVTLAEPALQADYVALQANTTVTFDVNFTAAQ